MKADAPEKLYIALNELTEDGRTFVLDHRVDYPICTEYIRKDAFIEKACQWLKTRCSDAMTDRYFIEDFKNALKL